MSAMAKSKYSGKPTVRTYYTAEELRAMLPQVGERRLEVMHASTSSQLEPPRAQPCTVVEVNAEHIWYRVRFDTTGLCQCYKLPDTRYTGPRGWT